tara:strand:- start:153 stop:521 length:369 start_codon:yes stop_codon:yes gene_type:complete
MKRTINTVAVLLTAMSLTSCYDFSRRQDELDAQSQGKQILLKAESSKKAKIEEAKADFESAELNAKSKKIEADAEAKAIETISKAITANPEYIKYMMVKGMYNNNKTVYVPTEANIPIIEKK